jgi:plasmid stabilization system protein ParE
MKVRYTLRARADLEEIYEYLAPTTDEAGVRELTLACHPYRIYYEVAGEEVRVLHIRHARRRPQGRKG